MTTGLEIPGRDGPYLIERFAESSVTSDDIIAMWEREDAVVGPEAYRRIGEVQLVATHDEDGLVGCNSVFLERNPRLDVDLWSYRVFVVEGHRRGGVANMMGVRILVEYETRFVTGQDTRGIGAVMRFENEDIQGHASAAIWQPGDFAFVGVNELGQQVRVRYFRGATVPVRESIRG